MWWFLSPIFFHFIAARRHFIHANYRVCSWHLYHVNNSTLWHNDATLAENFETFLASAAAEKISPSHTMLCRALTSPRTKVATTDTFYLLGKEMANGKAISKCWWFLLEGVKWMFCFVCQVYCLLLYFWRWATCFVYISATEKGGDWSAVF